MKPAVVLLSGGLDSATCLAIAGGQGFSCHCLSFDYGQRHHAELKAAERVAKALGAAEHRILNVDLAQFGGSALTDTSIAVHFLRTPSGSEFQALSNSARPSPDRVWALSILPFLFFVCRFAACAVCFLSAID